MPGQPDFRRASVLVDLHQEAASIPYARKAAQVGNKNAEFLLGRAYHFGLGVRPDMGQAFEWYRKSAQHGLPDGARHLAFMYEFGRGVAPDRKMALQYYDQAARGGNALAKRAAANLRSPDYDRPRGGGGNGGTSGGGYVPERDTSADGCLNRGGQMQYGSCQVYNGGGFTRIDPNTGQTLNY
jgi:hypothetical protein